MRSVTDPKDRIEVTPREIAGREDVLIVDVREPLEWAICHLPGSVLIPLGQLPERVGEIPGDRGLVLLCHHGVRSLRATHFLRQAGFPRAVSLAGGIDRWAREVDSTLARY